VQPEACLPARLTGAPIYRGALAGAARNGILTRIMLNYRRHFSPGPAGRTNFQFLAQSLGSPRKAPHVHERSALRLFPSCLWVESFGRMRGKGRPEPVPIYVGPSPRNSDLLTCQS
jgi:hypothetical protein